MNKHDVVFVHSFSEYVPQDNSILWEDGRVDFEMKLRILLALSPDISTSTVKKGDGRQSIWDAAGVVLSGGEVEYAEAGDAGTVVKPGTKQRKTSTNGYQQFHKNPGEGISSAIERATHYNEFVVREPSIGAIYFFYDENKSFVGRRYYDSLCEIGKRYDLPVYCLYEGELHEFDIERKRSYYAGMNEVYDVLNVGEKVDKDKLMSAKKSMSDEEKKRLFEGVLEDQPFDPLKLNLEEAVSMNNSEIGKSDFWFRQMVEDPNGGHEENYELFPDEDERYTEIPQGAKIKVFGDHYLSGKHIQCFTYGGKAFWRVKERNKKIGGSTYVSSLSNENYNMPSSKAEFLKKEEEKIADAIKMKKSPVGSFDVSNADNFLRNEAYRLFGFSLEAEKFGDTENAIRARELAESANMVTWEEYFSLHNKRMKNGVFIVTPEDLSQSQH